MFSHLNAHRVTQYKAFSGITLWAEAIFPPNIVRNLMIRTLVTAISALLSEKIALSRPNLETSTRPRLHKEYELTMTVTITVIV
ncbi:hypothetical protein [Photobacterium profundum]|uniref:Uncharacterized protein n=1 Tax=Photobacterium profundum (strain SS9) TaxID=298386 RepID=Q6LJH8_PHOPR|nr:hypothetical protein [Photobacterium profundum]CAG22552.1 hypothetical protein PBPRB0679 [Photobacterium profundum SS9]